MSSSTPTNANAVGLKQCFPRNRSRNLLAIAKKPASSAVESDVVRKSKPSESAEISALRGSKLGSFHNRAKTSCEASAEKAAPKATSGRISKSSPSAP